MHRMHYLCAKHQHNYHQGQSSTRADLVIYYYLDLATKTQGELPQLDDKISELPSTPSPSSSIIAPPRQQPRSGSRQPTTFSEWQLLAVLHRANLLQYYDEFIAQGGDDINQFMTCDEHEFLEIMSVVGMASKPLHVRRFQRTLTEFSKDPDAFNLVAIQQIGLPPAASYGYVPPTSSSTPTAALQFLLSSQNLAAASLAVAAGLPCTSPSITHDQSSPRSLLQPLVSASESLHELFNVATVAGVGTSGTTSTTATIGATANVMTGDFLTSLVAGIPQSSGSCNSGNGGASSNSIQGLESVTSSKVASTEHTSTTSGLIQLSAGSPASSNEANCDFDQLGAGTSTILETPVLTEAQIGRLAQCSHRLIEQMPQLEPKLIQNKKKISRELLDVMQLPFNSPQRLQEYRRYSAIYGRFDAKRKPDKPLTLHEVSVNEAAAQLCLRQPALLTRRDELFPLARQEYLLLQVVKDAGYNYVKGMKKGETDIKRQRSLVILDSFYRSELSQSPQSSASAGSPGLEENTIDSGNELAAASSSSSLVAMIGNRDDAGSIITSNRKKRRRESSQEQEQLEISSSVVSLVTPEKQQRLVVKRHGTVEKQCNTTSAASDDT
ncbi:NAB region 2 [Onchocerca flexuosa]|uniref:NAB region 2 n=1 Tax=Onchocerca flexuosa TaxID=387005 RepID=A0A238C2L0_9BILA|nr:NAB region 2 [Onchocerca flexuosa]